MAGALQNLDQRFPIVGEDGRPTDYFMRLLRGQSDAVALAGQGEVRGGDGLTGGGIVGDGVTLAVGAGTGIEVEADAVSLSDTAVTPGTYGEATKVPQITVDQKGRITDVKAVAISGGGGGGAPWYFNPPLAASFPTLIKTGGTDITKADNADVGMILTGLFPGGDHWKGCGKTPPTGDWWVKVRITYGNLQQDYSSISLIAANTVTNRLRSLGPLRDNSLRAYQTNWYFNSYGGHVQAGHTIPPANFFMYSYEAATDTLSGYYSADGKLWVPLGAATGASFLGGINFIGLGIYSSFGVGASSLNPTGLGGSCDMWEQSW